MLTVGNIAREGSRTRESQGQIAELDYTREIPSFIELLRILCSLSKRDPRGRSYG
jgi:hypothetical protein